MKANQKNTEKTLLQEFYEYLASVYFPQAEETLPSETVEWEYKNFISFMAH